MVGWKTKPLGDVTQFINGLWKGKEPPFVHVGVIRNTNFTKEGDLDDSDIAYLDVEAKKFQKRRLQFGDLILEKSGGGPKQPVGRVVFFDKTEGDFSFSNFTAAIRVADPSALDARFLHKYLHWVYVSGRTEVMQSHSTGIRNLNGDAYKAIKIAYPSLIEQRHIVAILDEAFEGTAAAKANAEKNLQNARELFELQLATSLRPGDQGWVDASIGDVCTLKSGTTVPVDIERQNGDVPYVKVAEMTMPANRDGVTTSIRFINQLDIKPSWLIPAGAVIFPKRGGAIMTNKKRLALVDICVDLNIMSVIPSEKLTSEFLYLYFLAVDMRKLGTGSSIPQINNYDIAPLLISFPASKARQLEITDALRDVETECQTLVALYDRKLAALDDLKKSLLHNAFTGQLTAKKADELVEAVA